MTPATLILGTAVTIISVLTLIFLVRYLSVKKQYAPSGTTNQSESQPAVTKPDIEGYTQRLAQLIQIPTISWTDRSKIDTDAFVRFQETLVKLYPKVHEVLDREVHGHLGLIYKWKGKNPDKKPVLFLAHYDVVQAGEKGLEKWIEPPFSGKVKDGVLWGRGTLDIKSQLAFQMESAELLLARGWQPDRDLFFAFGGDEEIGGTYGAGNLAAVFKEQGLEFEFVVDEGGIIAKDHLAFLKGRPTALIGVAEKGMVTFKITSTGESGHSSMPDRNGTAIGQLARGIARLEKSPFPKRLDPVVKNMLERFVPYVSTGLGLIFANLWFFSPLILLIFSKNRSSDSLIRTTQAATVFHSGEQENVLPGEATCLVNHRIMPGDTINSVLARDKRAIKDSGLTILDAKTWPANNPIQDYDLEASGFKLIQRVLARTHPGTIVAPLLVAGSTDSKYYQGLTRQILRFTPLVMTLEDVAAIHGINEKVSLKNLENGLNFYIQFFSHL